MNLFEIIKQGLAWCKFPWQDYNRRGEVLSRLHGQTGARVIRRGNDWAIAIDKDWLKSYVESIISTTDVSDAKTPEGSSGAATVVPTGESTEGETQDVQGGRGLIYERRKKGKKTIVRLEVDQEWLKNQIKRIMRMSDQSETEYEVDLGDHFGNTPDDVEEKTLADEDDSWYVETDTYQGITFLTNAETPLITHAVKRMTVEAEEDGADTIHHFTWYNEELTLDDKGNVIDVTCLPPSTYDLRVEGEAEEVAPPCGNPINNPNDPHGGGDSGGDPANPIDTPIPCGPEAEPIDDFPPIC